jgi:hypothetical protein
VTEEAGELADEFPDLALSEETAFGEGGEGFEDLNDDEFFRVCAVTRLPSGPASAKGRVRE